MDSKLDGATTALDRLKTDAGKKASAAAGKSMNIVGKEFSGVENEAGGELKEMAKGYDSFEKGLYGEIDEAVTEGESNMAEASKEAQQTEKNTMKSLDSAETNLEKDDEKIETLQEKMNEAGTSQSEKLVEVENSLQSQFRKATAQGTNTRSNMVQATNHEMELMKEQVQSIMKDQDGKVTAENNQRVSTELTNMQQTNKYFDQATMGLNEESQLIEEDINNMKVEGQQASSGVEALKGSFEAEEKRTEQMMLDQQSESVDSLKEGKDNLQDELEQATTVVQSTAASAKRNVEADLKSVEDDMGKKIASDLESRGQAAVSNTQRMTSGILTTAQELVARTEGEQTGISQKKADVEGRIPSTQEVISAAEGGIEQTVDGVNKQTKDADAKEEQSMLAKQQMVGEFFTKLLTNVEANIRGKTGKDAEMSKRTTTSLQDEADGLKSSSMTDFSNTEKDVASLKSETNAAEMRAKTVKEKADQESMSLTDGIESLKGEINAVSQQEERRTKEMSNSLASTVNDAFGVAKGKTTGTIDEAMKGEEVKLTKFVQDAENGFRKDEMSAQEYSNKAETRLGKIGDDVEHLRAILDKNKMEAVGEDQNLKNEMDGYKNQQLAMSERNAQETASEKDHIEAALKKMAEEFLSQVNQIEGSEQESAAQVQSEADSYNSEESDRLATEKQKVQAAVQLHEKRVAAQLKRVDDSVGKSGKQLKAFEDGENDAETVYGGEVSKLDSDMTTADDLVNKAVRDEDSSVAGTMNNEIGELEGLMGQLQGVEKGANSKIGDMKSNFKDELAFFANAGNAKSGELENKLKHVEDSAVDLVGEFKADTEASQNELASTQGRLGKVVTSTMDQMDAFKERLAEIRKSRETQAIALHNDVSDVKGEIFDVLNGTTNEIEMMKEETKEKYKRMERTQKEFDRMLVNASQMTSDHDDDKMQHLADTMYALDSNHSRLMSWQKQFKHYTGAWREEVRRKLQELNGGVSSDEDQIAASRLHSELSMQEGMRGLQKSVEGEVVEAVGKEAASVNGLVNNVRADMDNVFAKSEHEEEAKATALQNTKMELKNAQEASGTEMDKIKEAEGALNDKSNEFKTELAAANDAISGTLVLPQQSASAKNAAYNQRYTALQSRIAQLESMSGFLQTGDRSFDVDAQGEAGEQHEVTALTALNAQLRTENTALSDENDKAEAVVAQLKQQLEAAGVPLTM